MKLRSIDILLASAELEQAPLCTRLGRMFKQITSRFSRKSAPNICCFKEKVYFCTVFTPKAAQKPLGKARRKSSEGVVGHHIWKRRISRALFLTCRKRRKLSITVKELCNDRRPWVCNRLIAYTFALIMSLMYIAMGLCISAWGRSCSFRL